MTLTFWDGHRADEIAKRVDQDWLDFAHVYYRFHNDGDVPHHMTVKRLARAANVIVDTGWEQAGDYLERIGTGLLDSY